MEKAIGIDFGTTKCCVAVLNESGTIEIISNNEGNRTTPSCVAFTDIQSLVGEAAKDQSSLNSRNSLFNFKHLMGRRYDNLSHNVPSNMVIQDQKLKYKVEFKGKTELFYPEEISGLMLTKMKETAEEYLKSPVQNAVISVPAYFGNSQRMAIINAAKIAGLTTVSLVNGPSAAAIAFGINEKYAKSNKKRKVLIFDFGGGKLDVSVCQIRNCDIKVLSTSGIDDLGGENFVDNMTTFFINEFKKQCNKDLSVNPRSVRELRTACEKAMKNLSSSSCTRIQIDSVFEGIDFCASLTRQKFEELNADLLSRILDPVKRALENAHLEKIQLNTILMVGGTTRIPRVQAILKEFFDGMELNKTVNLDEAVAFGSAVLAEVLLRSKSTNNSLNLEDIIPYSVRVTTDDGLFMDLISPNSRIPGIKCTRFSYTNIYQTNRIIKVYESESHLKNTRSLLGLYEFVGNADTAELKLRCKIDRSGILELYPCENDDFCFRSGDCCSLEYNQLNELMKRAYNLKKVDAEENEKTNFKLYVETYCLNLVSIVRKIQERIPGDCKESDLNEIISMSNRIVNDIQIHELFSIEEYNNILQSLIERISPTFFDLYKGEALSPEEFSSIVYNRDKKLDKSSLSIEDMSNMYQVSFEEDNIPATSEIVDRNVVVLKSIEHFKSKLLNLTFNLGGTIYEQKFLESKWLELFNLNKPQIALMDPEFYEEYFSKLQNICKPVLIHLCCINVISFEDLQILLHITDIVSHFYSEFKLMKEREERFNNIEEMDVFVESTKEVDEQRNNAAFELLEKYLKRAKWFIYWKVKSKIISQTFFEAFNECDDLLKDAKLAPLFNQEVFNKNFKRLHDRFTDFAYGLYGQKLIEIEDYRYVASLKC